MDETQVRINGHYEVNIRHSRSCDTLSDRLPYRSFALSSPRKKIDRALVDINQALIDRQCRQPFDVVETGLLCGVCVASMWHIRIFFSYHQGDELIL